MAGHWTRQCIGNRERSTRVGFDYVHSLVNDHSRLAYSEILADEKGATCAGFLIRAIDYFVGHGITTFERLMTDNAWTIGTRCARCVPSTASGNVSSSLTILDRTARSNV